MTYYNYLIAYANGEKTEIVHCEKRMNLNEMDSFIVIDCPNIQNIGKRMRINLDHVLYIEETEITESE